jgi:hypothetical protein
MKSIGIFILGMLVGGISLYFSIQLSQTDSYSSEYADLIQAEPENEKVNNILPKASANYVSPKSNIDLPKPEKVAKE